MSDTVLPWEVDVNNDRWRWAMGFLNSRVPNLNRLIQAPPSDNKVKQIHSLMEYLAKSRNWVLCFCTSPRYMRELYALLRVVYVLTHDKTAEIIDVGDIVDGIFGKDNTLTERMENTDLVIVPWIDPGYTGFNVVRSKFVNMLLRRRERNMATITDITVQGLPHELSQCVAKSKVLMDSLGSAGYDCFGGDNSKWVTVSIKRGE